MDAMGRRRWGIPEGYIPSESRFSDRALVSHETACILNAGDRDAAGPFICASMISAIRSRYRAIPTTPRCSNPTCLSSSSIPGWIPVAPNSRCCRRWPMRKADRQAPGRHGPPAGCGITMELFCPGAIEQVRPCETPENPSSFPRWTSPRQIAAKTIALIVSPRSLVSSRPFVSSPANPGGPGDIVVLRLYYQYPVYVNLLGFNLSNLSGGLDLLAATAVFKNEPYASS